MNQINSSAASIPHFVRNVSRAKSRIKSSLKSSQRDKEEPKNQSSIRMPSARFKMNLKNMTKVGGQQKAVLNPSAPSEQLLQAQQSADFVVDISNLKQQQKGRMHMIQKMQYGIQAAQQLSSDFGSKSQQSFSSQKYREPLNLNDSTQNACMSQSKEGSGDYGRSFRRVRQSVVSKYTNKEFSQYENASASLKRSGSNTKSMDQLDNRQQVYNSVNAILDAQIQF